MQPRPSFDRTLLIPIAIGVVSILGIWWIFSSSNLRQTFFPPTAVPTAIPFDDNSLETKTASFFPTLDEPPPTVAVTSPDADPEETLPSTSTLVTESPPTPSATPTPDPMQLFRAGKFDDMDARIAYDPYWTVLKNLGTEDQYKGALHVSTGIGNEASFRFTGEGVRLGYQRGMNFGTVTVLIDDRSYSFHEQDFAHVWRSPPLSPGDHFVRIIHESGELINLDYIEILD